MAQNKRMETEGDFAVDGNLEVGGNVGSDLHVTGDFSVGAFPSLVRYLWVDGYYGDIGIGTSSPISTLTIEDNRAVISIEEIGTSPPGATSGYAKFFVDDGEMIVLNDSGNDTQLSSHADPRDYGEPQDPSFADPSVELPLSFHHKNRLLGKGAVVDLAAAVRDLEALTGKRYTTAYDLPEASALEVLERYAWIEIPFEEAWEEAEVMLPQTRTVFDYNPETGETFHVEERTGEPSSVGSGNYERRLKENVRFDKVSGKFLRRPTLAEIPQNATPDLPAWIADRLPQSE